MFKLVVLSVLLAVVAARPGYLHGEVAVAAPALVPSAVSHQSRTDIYSSPVVASYAAPVAHEAHIVPSVAVEAYAAPAVFAKSYGYAVPSAVSSQYRYDVVKEPVVAAYSSHPAYYSSHAAYGLHY